MNQLLIEKKENPFSEEHEEWLEAAWNNRKLGRTFNGHWQPLRFKDKAEIFLTLLGQELGAIEINWTEDNF